MRGVVCACPFFRLFEAWSQSYLGLAPWAASLCRFAASGAQISGCFSLNPAFADLRNQDNQHVSIGSQDFLLGVSLSPW